jgi:hypothetical protein
VPFRGPKKSRFSGPTPSNAPRNDVAPLKIITYRAIKTTGTLIVITMFGMGFAGSVIRQLLKNIITKFTGEVQTTSITKQKHYYLLLKSKKNSSTKVNEVYLP